ncbi:uncharacterized protein FOMMEDRAFT_23196 [Fomitiporia mediterranea MF3/22]|uniref:uncharacterized protein n=1 Tax=Fomitiporia mediterranea (strain MF3/22) TaxID=694068 RepID=UPI0004407506|nr:uncharacterized protein FOMMEDRAFT_23196 [Fomitiporia mediterranea MF3/22]EJC99324.1 hypothetical protein FOMMEDRAFT_23196 [Fomitiporia mediterranea MF3/22]
MKDEKLPVMKSAASDCDAQKRCVDIEPGETHLMSSSIETARPRGLDTDGSSDTIGEKRLLRRIDFTIIPWLAILLMLCFLDRSNMGNARLYNLEADLHLSDVQYLICLSLFYIPYVLCTRKYVSKACETFDLATGNNASMGHYHDSAGTGP